MTDGSLCEQILQAVAQSRAELQKSQVDLPGVSAYVLDEYAKAANSTERNKAFRDGQVFTAQALASVAYQVNTVAGHVLALLDAESRELDELATQVKEPQRVSSYRRLGMTRGWQRLVFPVATRCAHSVAWMHSKCACTRNRWREPPSLA